MPFLVKSCRQQALSSPLTLPCVRTPDLADVTLYRQQTVCRAQRKVTPGVCGGFGSFFKEPGASSTLPRGFRRQEIVLRRLMYILSVQTLDPVSSCSEWAMCGLRSWKCVNMVHWLPCQVYVKRPLDFLLHKFCIWVTSGFQSLSGCVWGLQAVGCERRGLDSPPQPCCPANPPPGSLLRPAPARTRDSFHAVPCPW